MNLPPFLKSRKFWSLIAGALVIILRQYVPDLPLDDAKLSELVLLLVAYIVGTGLEDAGNGMARLTATAAVVRAHDLATRKPN